ncbi:MAG: biotin carboxylase N-terminal domain-containing protein, partial [Nitrospinota bacterium]
METWLVTGGLGFIGSHFVRLALAGREDVRVLNLDKITYAGVPADEAVLIGPPEPLRSYLDQERIVQAAQATGAGAVHPGAGFLAEN